MWLDHQHAVQDRRGWSTGRLPPAVGGSRLDESASRGSCVGCVFQQVQRIVNQALKRYSEDRIGMVDYALESGGLCARPPRCAELGLGLAAPPP